MRKLLWLAAAVASFSAMPVAAAEVTVTGVIVQTQGHVSPPCRMVQLKTATDQLMWFRIPDVNNNDDGILAVTLTALATGKTVDIDYDPNRTTGCGTEPAIIWISIHGT